MGATEAVTSSISFMAGGGDMTADKAYIAHDDGPELITNMTGHVFSNAQSKKLLGDGGGNHYYTIDARGTDPVMTEQRARAAILESHNSAVGKSAQVTAEKVRRTPTKG